MRILVVGTGGVGAAVGAVAARRRFFERMVFADVAEDRARAVAAQDDRFGAAALDAGDRAAIVELAHAERVDAILNAVDPRFNQPVFDAALEAGCTYLDLAMTLSNAATGEKLGDYQFDRAPHWEDAGLLALVGIGVEPGLSDVFARHAADELFAEIDEVAVRDGADLVVDGYDFAPTFSIWTTIEECLNPPVVWERGRGWYTTEPFSEPEVFTFPEGIGPVECVNVEHEEVLLVPRWVDCRRVTFKYGLGEEFVDVLRTLHKLGLDSTEPLRVNGVDVAPRDVVAAALPDPATLGDRMRGRTCAGTFVTGIGTDGRPRATYLYHVVDNEQSMREWGHQAVVLQTALNPVVALELLAEGAWSGVGVLGPEAFPAAPFLDAARRVRRAPRRRGARAVTDRPEPLPPAERTVGQLIGESIRAYGRRFLVSALLIGVPFATQDVVAAQFEFPATLVVAIVPGALLLTAAYVAACVLALDVTFDAGIAIRAYALGLLIYAPFPLLVTGFVCPGSPGSRWSASPCRRCSSNASRSERPSAVACGSAGPTSCTPWARWRLSYWCTSSRASASRSSSGGRGSRRSSCPCSSPTWSSRRCSSSGRRSSTSTRPRES